MNAQNINQPMVKKESKNKIKVEFERTPLKERLKAKFISAFFLKKAVWFIFRLVLMLGISYIVLFPFFSKIAGSFMAPEDFVDVTVRLIPKHFSLTIYKAIILELNYFQIFANTLILSLTTAVIQTFSCALIAYGLAKFKFKGNKLVFLAVILTMIIPHQTLQLSMFMNFRCFDIFGILTFLSGGAYSGIGFLDNILEQIKILNYPQGINLGNTYWPFLILSATGLYFKNGLYIFMLRQFFRGVPDELEESAYIDGSGTLHTFINVILPLSVPMMITVFLFAFSWQWTDDFYSTMFISSGTTSDAFTRFLVFGKIKESSGIVSETFQLMPSISSITQLPASLQTDYAGTNMYNAAIRNTCGIMIILPLVILYTFCQRFLVQGIERSGITG